MKELDKLWLFFSEDMAKKSIISSAVFYSEIFASAPGFKQELKFSSLIFAIPLHNETNHDSTKHLKRLTNSKQDSVC